MNRYRAVITIVCVLFLVSLNVAYLWSFSQGKQSEYAEKVAQQPVQVLSFVILAVIIILGYLKPTNTEPEK